MSTAIVAGVIGWYLMGMLALAEHIQTWGPDACPLWQWPFVVTFWPLVYMN